MTCPAMQPDMASTAEIHNRLADKGLLPAEHFVDAAYVDAALLVGSLCDHGVSLEGPVRGVARRRIQAERAYEQRHFAIDWDREQVICPQGKTSVTWRAGLDEVGATCASRPCSAAPTAAPAPSERFARRPRPRGAPSTSTRALSTRP